MNLEAVKLAAADNVWTAIFPEMMLGCLALLLLVLEIVLPKKHHVVIPAGDMVSMTQCSEMLAEAKVETKLWAKIFNTALRPKAAVQAALVVRSVNWRRRWKRSAGIITKSRLPSGFRYRKSKTGL